MSQGQSNNVLIIHLIVIHIPRHYTPLHMNDKILVNHRSGVRSIS